MFFLRVTTVNIFGLLPLCSPSSRYKACLLPTNDSVVPNGTSGQQNGGHTASYSDGPFYASIISNERVTAPDHFQDVRLIKFDIKASNIK